MGASVGMLGTARAQYHLRQSFVFLNMAPINRPEVMVAFANKKVDENGNLIDETTKKLVRELLESLVAWTKKLQGASKRSQGLSLQALRIKASHHLKG